MIGQVIGESRETRDVSMTQWVFAPAKKISISWEFCEWNRQIFMK